MVSMAAINNRETKKNNKLSTRVQHQKLKIQFNVIQLHVSLLCFFLLRIRLYEVYAFSVFSIHIFCVCRVWVWMQKMYLVLSIRVCVCVIIDASPHLTGTLQFFFRMLNLFAFYFKIAFRESSLHIFCCFVASSLNCVVLCFWFWVAFSFHKFPMLITARFTPNQNKLCGGWRLCAVSPLDPTGTLSPIHFASIRSYSCSLFSSRVFVSVYQATFTVLSQIEKVACAALLCVCVRVPFVLLAFLQVFSIALMYAYQNIQMFTLLSRYIQI